MKTIVSNEEGQEHCWINQNAKLSLGWFEAGTEIAYQLSPMNKCVYVFVMGGQLKAAGETIGKRDAIGFWETGSIKLRVEQEAEFIVIEVPVNH